MAAVGNPDPLEFSDVRATEDKLKPLVKGSGGGMMQLQENPDPDIRSVRPRCRRLGLDRAAAQ